MLTLDADHAVVGFIDAFIGNRSYEAVKKDLSAETQAAAELEFSDSDRKNSLELNKPILSNTLTNIKK